MGWLRLEIHGTPAPQGSHRAFVNPKTGKAIVTQASAATRPWRDTVRAFAIDHKPLGWTPLDGPLWARMVFSVARPATAPKKVLYPSSRPDLSKLLRAVEDSLTEAGIWTDDARVVAYTRLAKVFAGSEDPDALDVPGVLVEVTDEVPASLAEFMRRSFVEEGRG